MNPQKMELALLYYSCHCSALQSLKQASSPVPVLMTKPWDWLKGAPSKFLC